MAALRGPIPLQAHAGSVMAEEIWLPLAEVARRSNVPETTARRYARLFPDALPHRRDGRTLLYAPEAGAVLTRIGQLFSEGLSASQVSKALRAESQCIDVEAAGGRSNPAGRQALAAGQLPRPREDGRHRLAEFLRHVVDQKQAIATLREDFSQVRRELAEERARRGALEEENRKIKKALILLMRQRRAAAGGQAAQPQAGGGDLRAKLGVLEQELVRLRKDRREFEKYILEKIGKQG